MSEAGTTPLWVLLTQLDGYEVVQDTSLEDRRSDKSELPAGSSDHVRCRPIAPFSRQEYVLGVNACEMLHHTPPTGTCRDDSSVRRKLMASISDHSQAQGNAMVSIRHLSPLSQWLRKSVPLFV